MRHMISDKLPAELYTLASVVIGFALIDDLTANEQNAWGNWFMALGQILETNSAIQQVVEERIIGNTININCKNAKQGGDPYMHNKSINSHNDVDAIAELQKIISIMQIEIEKLKKDL